MRHFGVLIGLLCGLGCANKVRDFNPPPNESHVDAGRDAGNCNPSTCGATFVYPYNGESSVELHGDFNHWGSGIPMLNAGAQWSATVPDLENRQTVAYKFLVNASSWVTDPANPQTEPDGFGGNNSVMTVNCDTCAAPSTDGGVFDWRDAVIYFAFVDRFLDGNPANNCSVSGTESTATTSTNYLGGDWAGITQKINQGYFNDLGVNTLWITVPIKNADNVAEPGANGDSHMYSAYHGYWPSDPTQTEACFGTAAELQELVAAAHAKQLRVLFDYAMVHVHTSSPLYQQHQNDGWFTSGASACICGSSSSCPYDTTCWFTPYLAHYDYTNAAARNFSVNAAIQLIQQNGNDAFRLDAIKQVDTSWLAALRPAVDSQILVHQSLPQRFYMVGETYDFQNRALIKSMVDPQTQLDGQFDFPLRIRIVEAVLMRSTANMLTIDDLNWSRNARPGMAGLADFFAANDGYYGADAVMSTFIGNHDLPRSIHFAEDTPFWSDSATDGKANAWSDQPALSTNPNAYERLANAFAVLMTNPGAPLIYYGDEIGLPGAGDPDNRRMMQWSGYSPPQTQLLARVQALTALRAAHPAFRRGTRQTLEVDEDLWVYSMSGAGETLYVAINRSDGDRQTSVLPAGLTELLTNAPAASPAVVPARQTRIFR
jgi:glycosidase